VLIRFSMPFTWAAAIPSPSCIEAQPDIRGAALAAAGLAMIAAGRKCHRHKAARSQASPSTIPRAEGFKPAGWKDKQYRPAVGITLSGASEAERGFDGQDWMRPGVAAGGSDTCASPGQHHPSSAWFSAGWAPATALAEASSTVPRSRLGG
jgi:hypothetical protein